ncbi:emerin (Emery-Dreifuss muscular dystrophy) isoform X2 [Triplophysa dalaica]|uniref:emerin (Emery-Dreifuss muscular dystrophy) isoform X2 n=1 Tax=Triplophysa dalaica TaxID=1582913 RepID=UPI0024DFA225|nr:emerin (Emery-Dreifuss muscular dystrophy) isoform X2 [Triplophysa dalaica]
MASLSDKSDKDIGLLLDEYGIKHGPIVDSTRKLYEKKLKEAMTKNTKPSPSDKTFYREEQEEVEYVTFQPQQSTLHDGSGDVIRRSKVADSTFAQNSRSSQYTNFRDDYTHKPSISQTQTTYQTSRPGPSVSKTTQLSASSENKSGGVPGWLRILVFLVIAVFLYYVYSTMEPAEEGPFKKIK